MGHAARLQQWFIIILMIIIMMMMIIIMIMIMGTQRAQPILANIAYKLF